MINMKLPLSWHFFLRRSFVWVFSNTASAPKQLPVILSEIMLNWIEITFPGTFFLCRVRTLQRKISHPCEAPGRLNFIIGRYQEGGAETGVHLLSANDANFTVVHTWKRLPFLCCCFSSGRRSFSVRFLNMVALMACCLSTVFGVRDMDVVFLLLELACKCCTQLGGSY